MRSGRDIVSFIHRVDRQVNEHAAEPRKQLQHSWQRPRRRMRPTLAVSGASTRMAVYIPPHVTQAVWRTRYSQSHRPMRVATFPPCVTPPKKVRIYHRRDHYLLHFWDPAHRKTLYDRVNGDLIDAIAKARQIEQRLNDYRASGHVGRRLTHEEVVALFREDLNHRGNAATIALSTARRYGSALGHYLDYVRSPQISVAYPLAMRVDRSFALGFSAFLGARMISPNGRIASDKVTMKGQDFVLDAVRTMFEWAADPTAAGTSCPLVSGIPSVGM